MQLYFAPFTRFLTYNYYIIMMVMRWEILHSHSFSIQYSLHSKIMKNFLFTRSIYIRNGCEYLIMSQCELKQKQWLNSFFFRSLMNIITILNGGSIYLMGILISAIHFSSESRHYSIWMLPREIASYVKPFFNIYFIKINGKSTWMHRGRQKNHRHYHTRNTIEIQKCGFRKQIKTWNLIHIMKMYFNASSF